MQTKKPVTVLLDRKLIHDTPGYKEARRLDKKEHVELKATIDGLNAMIKEDQVTL